MSEAQVSDDAVNKNRTNVRAIVELIALMVFPACLATVVIIGQSIYHQGFYLGELLFPLTFLVLTIAAGVIGFRMLRMTWRNEAKRKTRLKILFGWLGWFGLSTVLFYPIITIPTGARRVPRTEPSEAKRIFHPLGFSIVPLPDWKIQIYSNSEPNDLSDSFIRMNPGGRSRRAPGLGVWLWFRPNDLTNYQPTVFRGKPAFEQTRIVGTGGRTRLSYELFIPQGTNWFRVTYSEDASWESPPHTNFPPIIRRYIETFRLPGETDVPPGNAGKSQ